MNAKPFTLTAITLGAFLAGCRGAGTTGSVPSGMTPSVAHHATSSSGDLLYVTYYTQSDPSENIAIVTFPGGQFVAPISVTGQVTTLCSDTFGNVWANTDTDSRNDVLYKFAHGGTTPIAELTIPKGGSACAVDPTTGNVAAATVSLEETLQPSVYIWKPSGSGYSSPKILTLRFAPQALTYDASGNLFTAGRYTHTSPRFAMAELVRGKNKFMPLSLNKPTQFASSLQWDGKHVTLNSGEPGTRAHIYQLRIAGSKALVVKTLYFKGMLKYPPEIWISGNVILGQMKSVGRAQRTGFWRYPQGGKRLGTISLYGPLTVSVASTHK